MMGQKLYNSKYINGNVDTKLWCLICISVTEHCDLRTEHGGSHLGRIL